MLDMTLKDLERVLYFENYIVSEPGLTPLTEKQLLSEEEYKFPPFVWNYLEYMGWKDTKYPKERGTKKREYNEVA